MSLISEALRKSRGDQPGSAYPAPHAPPRRTLAPWLAAAVSLGVAAGVLIGVFMLRDSPEEAAAPVEIAAVEPATSGAAAPVADAPDPASAAESGLPATEPEPAQGGGGAAGPEPAAAPGPETTGLETDRAPPQAPPPAAATSVEAPAFPPADSPPAIEERQAPAAPPAASAPRENAPTDGSSYLRQVALPGGAQVALGGIAWSESNPAALINGRVLGLGEGRDDWTVAAIERDRVQIQWRGMHFFLRLK